MNKPAVKATESTDQFDTWFDVTDEESGEVQPAEEYEYAEEGGPSLPEDELVPDPGEEVPADDAADDAALEEGTSTKDDVKGTDDPYAWVAELDPEMKKQVEALVHSDQSQKGRVAALQRQLDSTRAEQEAHARVAPKAAAAKAVAEGKPLEDMDDEELAAFIEEFPTVARNVEKMFEKRLKAAREELLEEVRPLKEGQLKKEITERKEALRVKASHIFNTAQTGVDMDDVLGSRAFKEWFDEQPPGYQSFARTAEGVDDAAKVLTDFAQYMDKEVNNQLGSERAEDDTSATSTQSADQLASRRKQALRGTGVKSKSAQVKTGGSVDDYDAYFNQAASEVGN